jgi:hypothetical protein
MISITLFYAGRFVETKVNHMYQPDELSIYEGGFIYATWDEYKSNAWYIVNSGGFTSRIYTQNLDMVPIELKLQILLMGMT